MPLVVIKHNRSCKTFMKCPPLKTLAYFTLPHLRNYNDGLNSGEMYRGAARKKFLHMLSLFMCQSWRERTERRILPFDVCVMFAFTRPNKLRPCVFQVFQLPPPVYFLPNAPLMAKRMKDFSPLIRLHVNQILINVGLILQ